MGLLLRGIRKRWLLCLLFGSSIWRIKQEKLTGSSVQGSRGEGVSLWAEEGGSWEPSMSEITGQVLAPVPAARALALPRALADVCRSDSVPPAHGPRALQGPPLRLPEGWRPCHIGRYGLPSSTDPQKLSRALGAWTYWCTGLACGVRAP